MGLQTLARSLINKPNANKIMCGEIICKHNRMPKFSKEERLKQQQNLNKETNRTARG